MFEEFSAFKSRVQDHTLLADRVDTSIRLTEAGETVRANYVVLFPAVPDALDDRRYLSTQSPESTRTITYDCRAVAVDPGGVLLLAGAVIGQMVGHKLIVPDRVCEPIRLVEGVEEGRVEFDRTARLFYVDFSLRFESRRA